MLLGTLHFIHKTVSSEGSKVFWVDYFCLRQYQQDFEPKTVLEVVKEIDTLAALIGFSMQVPPGSAPRMEAAYQGWKRAFTWAPYLERDFCILKLCAAVIGGAVLACNYWMELGRRPATSL
jgi:hypothetical protein